MDVKQAVNVAKQYIADLYVDENLTNLGLEEVEFDDRADVWNVTIGFNRPWDRENPFSGGTRSYKILVISNPDGSVKAMRNRLPAA